MNKKEKIVRGFSRIEVGKSALGSLLCLRGDFACLLARSSTCASGTATAAAAAARPHFLDVHSRSFIIHQHKKFFLSFFHIHSPFTCSFVRSFQPLISSVPSPFATRRSAAAAAARLTTSLCPRLARFSTCGSPWWPRCSASSSWRSCYAAPRRGGRRWAQRPGAGEQTVRKTRGDH